LFDHTVRGVPLASFANPLIKVNKLAQLLFRQHIGLLSIRQQRALSGCRTRLGGGSVSAMAISSNPYRGFRFPAEVIEHAVWPYHCFSLSLRDVELILAARGIVVSYESIREWGLRFGRLFANKLKRRRPRPGDKWHIDEVFVRIRGKLHYLWRAVDQEGRVLDILVQSRRNAGAARRIFSQAAARFAIRAEGDHHRQAAQLRCCETRDPARH
jgi:putative transposase